MPRLEPMTTGCESRQISIVLCAPLTVREAYALLLCPYDLIDTVLKSYELLLLSGVAVDGVVDVLEGELCFCQVGGGAAAVGAVRAHAQVQLRAVGRVHA